MFAFSLFRRVYSHWLSSAMYRSRSWCKCACVHVSSSVLKAVPGCAKQRTMEICNGNETAGNFMRDTSFDALVTMLAVKRCCEQSHRKFLTGTNAVFTSGSFLFACAHIWLCVCVCVCVCVRARARAMHTCCVWVCLKLCVYMLSGGGWVMVRLRVYERGKSVSVCLCVCECLRPRKYRSPFHAPSPLRFSQQKSTALTDRQIELFITSNQLGNFYRKLKIPLKYLKVIALLPTIWKSERITEQSQLLFQKDAGKLVHISYTLASARTQTMTWSSLVVCSFISKMWGLMVARNM